MEAYRQPSFPLGWTFSLEGEAVLPLGEKPPQFLLP